MGWGMGWARTDEEEETVPVEEFPEVGYFGAGAAGKAEETDSGQNQHDQVEDHGCVATFRSDNGLP